jgi:Abnormal spindle-like microcephaly-assoc'd, ASPM-SPD-2-Hydin
MTKQHSCLTRRFIITTIALSSTMLATTLPQPIPVRAASLNAAWQAPTTNVDGSQLTNLTGYHVYVATSSPACHAASAVTVGSPTAAPAQGDTLTYRLSNLTAGTTYVVAVSAVDSLQLESPCVEASGTAHASFNVTPSQVDFGSIAVGQSVDKTFAVSNAGSGTVSLSVAASAPFTLVTGNSYTIAPGTTQNVTVRFSPTSRTTFTGNVTFTADGDTLSSGVTGTGTQRGRKSRA